MTASVLQSFLRESLLELEGDDDTRLNKLRAAATAVAADFAARPLALAFPALFAALAQEDEATHEALDQVAQAVEAEWSTYRSAFKGGKATTLFRAVALQGLVEAIETEPRLGTAIALLLRNLRAVMPAGKYESAIGLVAAAAESAFKAEQNEAMATVAPDGPVLAPAAKAGKIDRASLQKRIDAAVGPHNRAGQAVEGANGHWPNEGPPWSHNFSDKLAAVIADYIDHAMNESAKLDAKNHTAVSSSLADVGMIEPAMKRSASLLWWRQAMYSESAEQPYRALSVVDAIVHAVIDLSEHIPPAYVRALDSFLMEAILALKPGVERIGIAALSNLSAHCATELAGALKFEPPVGLAISVLSKKEAGDPIADPSLTPQEWAVWLMREVMAVRAVEGIQEATEQSSGDE